MFKKFFGLGSGADSSSNNAQERVKELEKIIEDKERLLRVLAHDIKGPVGSMTGLSELLLENIENGTSNKEELVKILKVIKTVGENIEILVAELSEWNQKDTIEPKISTIDVITQVNNVVGLLLSQASAKQIELKSVIPSNISVVADLKMLRIILRNLTSNAIKFTKQGGHVLISCERKNNAVEIYVDDNGIGLLEEKKEKLLTEFLGESTLGTEGEKGTGLGLRLCVDFIAKMGGSIRVESNGEDKGAKFTITLPAGEQAETLNQEVVQNIN